MRLSRRRTYAIAAASVLLAAVFLFARHIWRGVLSDVHPARRLLTPAEVAQAKRELPTLTDVALRTSDGLRLSGWYAPGNNGAAVVLVHGAWSNRAALLTEAVRLSRHGYGVLLYDARASGDSEGTCTWGDRERGDVAAAVDFLAAQPEVKRIGALGFSIGASAVSGAAAKDARIRAIVLEGATSSLREAEDADHSLYGVLAAYPTRLVYRAYGVRFEEVDVVAALKAMAPRPVLVAIGSADPYVFRWMTDEVFAAAPEPKSLYVVPGAGHGDYVPTGGDAYLDTLVAFFDGSLGEGNAAR
jgi:fermentation-respiration switch protein FrsA (DUF1100 family)